MKIGVISEGHADRAVITNILTGLTGLDTSDITPLRPTYKLDETDKAILSSANFSTWSEVKKECQQRQLIDGFLSLEGQDFIVIHIDSAEGHEYGIKRPKKGQEYCCQTRELIIEKINEWLKDDISDQIIYAVAVEEIEAWILTIYDKNDSSKYRDAKGKMDIILGKRGINTTSTYDNFLSLSKPLSKPKDVYKNKFLDYNCSLKAFFEEVKAKVKPSL